MPDSIKHRHPAFFFSGNRTFFCISRTRESAPPRALALYRQSSSDLDNSTSQLPSSRLGCSFSTQNLAMYLILRGLLLLALCSAPLAHAADAPPAKLKYGTWGFD